MQLKPLVIALQGIGFGSLATAVQGFVDFAEEKVGKAGGAKGKKRFTPWHWVPYTPVKTRSRKKREQELVAFLNP